MLKKRELTFDIPFPDENFIISAPILKTLNQNHVMKRVLLALVCLAVSCIGFAQPCTPNASSGNPGVFPAPDSIPCIERNVPYDFTMQLENFDTLTFTIAGFALDFSVDSTRIDSIENFPCGISWQASQLLYLPGETGCINVSGTTREPVGQYPVKIYMTFYLNNSTLGPQVLSGELNDLIAQLEDNAGPQPYDYFYVSRVINAGDACPARDTAATAVTSGDNCPSLSVEITGNTSFCGGSETLTAVPSYEEGTVSFLWGGGETTDAISVSSSGTYSVTITDDNGSVSASVTVDTNAVPTAGFTYAVNGLTVTFTNTSVNATNYYWDFDDGNSSVAVNEVHTYATDGTYEVTLTENNNCGADTFTVDITVSTPPCVPNAATGNAGVFPHPDSIPCIERLVPYDYTMQTENFDTFSFDIQGFAANAYVLWTRIDSVENFPCGISWESDKMQYAPGETGCIRVSGTSREITGQYPVKIYMTMRLDIDVPVLGGEQEFSGELNDLVRQLEDIAGPLGYDFKYMSRVINAGDSCPARDTTEAGVSSGDVCPPLGVVIEGNPTICSGQPTTLTAVAQYETGTPAFVWSDNSTAADLTVSSTGTYSVTVTDQTGTASESVTVGTGTPPAAGFTAVASTGIVTVNNTSTGGGTYLWNFGDPASGSSNTSTQASPLHTYTANGTYTITLTLTNNCGTDTHTQTVTITGVFITSVEYDLTFDMFPNPSNGTVALQFSSEHTKEVYELNIYDLTGKNMYRERITSVAGTVQKQLDLNALAKGVYTLRLSSEKGFGMKKLILN